MKTSFLNKIYSSFKPTNKTSLLVSEQTCVKTRKPSPFMSSQKNLATESINEISANQKQIKWRKLTDAEINKAMEDKQVISNCYDEATRYVLCNTPMGRECIRDRIMIQKGETSNPMYKCKFHINGKEEIYRSTPKDYYKNHSSIYEAYKTSSPHDKNIRVSMGVNVCVCKLIHKHPTLKPFFAWLYAKPLYYNRACEFNRPSNAFKWFTGKQPIAIGESGINMSLKKYKTETTELLNDLAEKSPKNYSFVALTGFKKPKGIGRWHTLPITDVKKDFVEVLNKRTNQKTSFTFDEFIDGFKAIIGLKWPNK